MAAPPFEGPVPTNSLLFNIYSDGQAGRQTSQLPGGACNFIDLTPGANGARCGCRRFWSTGGQATPNPAQAWWCMCSHHACYHDDTRDGQETAPPVDNVTTAGQENQKPRSANREPLSPVQDMPPAPMSPNVDMSLDFPMINFNSSFITRLDGEPAPQDNASITGPQESSLPDTLSWGNFIQSQPGNASVLPPIPQQCLMVPTGPPSTATSSQGRYLRPFAGRGLNTLDKVSSAKQKMIASDGEAALAPGDNGMAKSAGAGPEPADLPTMPNTPERGQRVRGSEKQEVGAPPWPSRMSFERLSTTVQNHEERLDKLETASFSIQGHDDCHERHEHADLRVSDLESRVEEVERILGNDTSSLGSGRRSHRRVAGDDAASTAGSVSTNATPRGSERSDMYNKIQALEAQVNQLRASSLPSFNHPMELEVVFLPFPLTGLWLDAREFSAQRQSGSRGATGSAWTQLPNTHSRSTPDPQSPDVSGWISHEQEATWLLPRACAPGRLIDQRLKSRGLIRTVSIRGADARSVQLAINAAFGDALATRVGNTSGLSLARHASLGADARLATCHGLRHPWIPLRKLHKDSRLRFLTPAEMMTPTLWDVAFLTSSVVMKATGLQRLYVTQPEAYLQDHAIGRKALESGWTWHKLRGLSRVYPDSQASSDGEVPEADALEACWAYNDRLDEAPDTRRAPPLSLRETSNLSKRSSTSPSQQFYTGQESPILSMSPIAPRAQSPQVSRTRKGSKPPHIRTTSMPPVFPEEGSPSFNKRRVASYANTPHTAHPDRRPSPFTRRPSPRLATVPVPSTSAAAVAKPRRATRSPSLRPRNTPRWSNASMSRSPSMVPAGPAAYDEHADRRTTPFYYATPHSNAPFEPPPNTRATSRARVAAADDDEEMDDRGSMTDPDEDSQMTNDVDDAQADYGYGYTDDAGDVDLDIDVYEDEPEELEHVEFDLGSGRRRSQSHVHTYGQGQGQGPLLPEDEPWPGIEDHMSDGENREPRQAASSHAAGDRTPSGHDAHSDASSQPSEYPSTQSAWRAAAADAARQGSRARDGAGVSPPDECDDENGAGFRIHEDEADMVPGGLETQWQ